MGHIERGNVSPSLKTINQIALALGITLNDLLVETNSTNPAWVKLCSPIPELTAIIQFTADQIGEDFK